MKNETKYEIYENICKSFDEYIGSLISRHMKSLKRWPTVEDNLALLDKLQSYFNRDKRMKEYKDEVKHFRFMTDFIYEDDVETSDWYKGIHWSIRAELKELFENNLDRYQQVDITDSYLNMLINVHFDNFFDNKLDAVKKKVESMSSLNVA